MYESNKNLTILKRTKNQPMQMLKQEKGKKFQKKPL